jgi:hypothetical protein
LLPISVRKRHSSDRLLKAIDQWIFGDKATVKQLQQDVRAWWANVVDDENKVEYIRAHEYSDALKLYKIRCGWDTYRDTVS